MVLFQDVERKLGLQFVRIHIVSRSPSGLYRIAIWQIRLRKVIGHCTTCARQVSEDILRIFNAPARQLGGISQLTQVFDLRDAIQYLLATDRTRKHMHNVVLPLARRTVSRSFHQDRRAIAARQADSFG